MFIGDLLMHQTDQTDLLIQEKSNIETFFSCHNLAVKSIRYILQRCCSNTIRISGCYRNFQVYQDFRYTSLLLFIHYHY